MLVDFLGPVNPDRMVGAQQSKPMSGRPRAALAPVVRSRRSNRSAATRCVGAGTRKWPAAARHRNPTKKHSLSDLGHAEVRSEDAERAHLVVAGQRLENHVADVLAESRIQETRDVFRQECRGFHLVYRVDEGRPHVPRVMAAVPLAGDGERLAGRPPVNDIHLASEARPVAGLHVPFLAADTVQAGRLWRNVDRQMSRMSKLATCSNPARSKPRSSPPPPENSESACNPCGASAGMSVSGSKLGVLTWLDAPTRAPLPAAIFRCRERADTRRYQSLRSSEM